MSCYSLNKIEIPFMNKTIILFILQIITLYHATMLGWKVKRIGKRKYELSKNISEITNFDLNNFLSKIVTLESN